MGIADEIARLREPHLSGALSDTEFEAAERPDPLGHTCRPGQASPC